MNATMTNKIEIVLVGIDQDKVISKLETDIIERWINKDEMFAVADHYIDCRDHGVIVLYSDEWKKLQKFIVDDSVEKHLK